MWFWAPGTLHIKRKFLALRAFVPETSACPQRSAPGQPVDGDMQKTEGVHAADSELSSSLAARLMPSSAQAQHFICDMRKSVAS